MIRQGLDLVRNNRILSFPAKMILIIFAFFFYQYCTISNADAERIWRSSSLKIIKTSNGNIEKIDFVNEAGEITDAADKHYASIVKTKEGRTILEEYYDSRGIPAEQSTGYYAILREYDENEQEYKITYLNYDKQPMIISLGYAVIIRSYAEDGNVITDRYYDTKCVPVKSKNDGFGSRKYINDLGRNYLIIHLDENDNPMIAGNGYAMMKRTYYESGISKGLVQYEYYLDEQGKPISLKFGQYGLYKEYDEFRRSNVLTYLDSNGRPIIITKGYATIKRNFYEDDTVKTEMYYDQIGNPIRLADGQYGILKQDDKIYYLNQYGERYFDLIRHLNNSRITVIVIAIVISLLALFFKKATNVVLLFGYIFFIIYITVMHRNNVRTGVVLEPLWSYRQFLTNPELQWEIISNIILFIPLGVIVYRIYPKWIILLLPLILSVAIEILQYYLKTGLSELDDIFSNGAGGCIGFLFGKLTTSLKQRINIRKQIHSM